MLSCRTDLSRETRREQAPDPMATRLGTDTLREANLAGRTNLGGVVCKIADCRAEREAAFRLIAETYGRRGLAATDGGMHVTAHHLLPTTDIFLAVHRRQVVFTMTLVRDGDLGLPLENVYPQEIGQLRDRGLELAEAAYLASRNDYFEGGKKDEVFGHLLSLLFQAARAGGVERLLVGVPPRQVRFYQEMLGFRQIGDLRERDDVGGDAIMALEHNFARMDRERYRLYNRIYGTTFHRWELLPQPMSNPDREYFGAAVSA